MIIFDRRRSAKLRTRTSLARKELGRRAVLEKGRRSHPEAPRSLRRRPLSCFPIPIARVASCTKFCASYILTWDAIPQIQT